MRGPSSNIHRLPRVLAAPKAASGDLHSTTNGLPDAIAGGVPMCLGCSISQTAMVSAIDAVDGSSPGTRVPNNGRRLRLPRFGGAAYAVNFNDWSGYREVGLSSAWGRCSRPGDHPSSAQAPFRAVLL